MEWLQTDIGNNSLYEWLTALAVGTTLLIMLRLAKWGVLRYLARRAPKNHSDGITLATAMTHRTLLPFFLVFALYAGVQLLTLPPGLITWISSIALGAMVLQVTLWAGTLANHFLIHSQQRHLEKNAARVTTLRAAAFMVKLILAAIATVLILDNIPGVEITALVASLGITGIAVALAVQNILSDLFASLSIVLDRPFVIGDFIIVDDCLGTVEHIGLKTTHVRSLSGEQLVFSNNDLLKSRIRNYKRMAERRVVFTLGVTYQTPPDKLKAIPDIIRDIVNSQQPVRFDRAHFQGYGDFALRFEIVYYVLDPDYNRYMDIQQAINLTIFETFQDRGIDFAYPTRTIHIAPARDEAPAKAAAEAN
jgi:small-conductance mechanosensitive channel